jgi:hypothetical protein
MLTKRARILHMGIANYCWFTDPSRALCLKLAGTPTADRPLAGMCDSARCDRLRDGIPPDFSTLGVRQGVTASHAKRDPGNAGHGDLRSD